MTPATPSPPPCWPEPPLNAPLTLTNVPLLPLASVVFPGGRLTLRAVAAPTRHWLERCAAAGAPFGVVTPRRGSDETEPLPTVTPPAARFHDFGTLAALTDAGVGEAAASALQILGRQVFRLRDCRMLRSGLWVADVELLNPDRPAAIPADLARVRRPCANCTRTCGCAASRPGRPMRRAATRTQVGSPTAGPRCCRHPHRSSCSSWPSKIRRCGSNGWPICSRRPASSEARKLSF